MNARLTVICILLSLLIVPNTVSANAPYTTWILGPSGIIFPTQDAYVPLDEIILDVSSPEDMFYAPDGFIYIADTGNGRILKLDTNLVHVAELGQGLLVSPTGIVVDTEGTLYIADSGTNTIVILNPQGQLIRQFGRPVEPLFGANRDFLPRKLAVDARQNIYVVSEGSVDGLVMLNTNGNFIGYFGANLADMSLKMILQRLFLTEEQLDQFIRNEAPSPSNIAIDERSLIYTITAGTQRPQSIRKFNIAGKNLFRHSIFGSRTFRDIDVSSDGLFLAVDSSGHIFEYDHNGFLTFVFGALDEGNQRLGLLSNPTAIERVGNVIYVLDKEKNAIVTYQVTAFAERLHAGVRLYQEGFYTEARPYFEDVLNYNGLIILAYQALANADFKEGNYAHALEYYRYGEDRNGYSEAFWELRNAILQEYLGIALVGMVGLWFISKLLGYLTRRYQLMRPFHRFRHWLAKIRLVDDVTFLFRFIKQPADSFYYIKYNEKGSLTFALLIYLWVVVSHVISLYFTGFIFSPYYSTSWEVHVEMEIIYAILPLVLWNSANYLVASISDGEGKLRHVLIGTAYSLFPYVLMSVPITLFSNLLTQNEAFLYTFSTQIMWGWTFLMLFIMVREIHNYTISETTRNVLTTLFTMAMFMLIGYILYILFNQLYEFIIAILQEASLRG